MSTRHLHLVHLLIRHRCDGQVCFLVYPHERWRNAAGEPYLALPAKKTVADPLAEFRVGTPLDTYVDRILQEEFGVPADAYALEQELRAVHMKMVSPATGLRTHYTIYPIDLWVDPAQREPLRQRKGGVWLTCEQAASHPQVSPTAGHILRFLPKREVKLDAHYARYPQHEEQPEAPRRLLKDVSDRPSMDARAKQWLSHNLRGVRHLPRKTLDEILEAGHRAFNLRVADPYLRYQMQGQGFTWSFFTDKESQDCHVHGAPVVEIYGILEGRMEIWWKPYYERGTAAWNHRILETGDWLEVDSLQCHIVHWLTRGKGVVFKAGPGPLAEVGKLGITGKTQCIECPCMKPTQVRALEVRRKSPAFTEPEPEPEPQEDTVETAAIVRTLAAEDR
jgi:hypothetical protein